VAKEELFPNLTLQENLSLPLIFRPIEKKIRDEMIDKALLEEGLMAVANKFGRYLTENEKKKALSLHTQFWKTYPELGKFLNILEKRRDSRLCLPLIQHEIFRNISKDLRTVVKEIKDKDLDGAVHLLEEAVDKLTLRTALARFYETPSVRVIEVLLLVLRNYRDLFKYRAKMNEKFLEETEERTIMDLKSLADSFEELS